MLHLGGAIATVVEWIKIALLFTRSRLPSSGSPSSLATSQNNLSLPRRQLYHQSSSTFFLSNSNYSQVSNVEYSALSQAHQSNSPAQPSLLNPITKPQYVLQPISRRPSAKSKSLRHRQGGPSRLAGLWPPKAEPSDQKVSPSKPRTRLWSLQIQAATAETSPNQVA